MLCADGWVHAYGCLASEYQPARFTLTQRPQQPTEIMTVRCEPVCGSLVTAIGFECLQNVYEESALIYPREIAPRS